MNCRSPPFFIDLLIFNVSSSFGTTSRLFLFLLTTQVKKFIGVTCYLLGSCKQLMFLLKGGILGMKDIFRYIYHLIWSFKRAFIG